MKVILYWQTSLRMLALLACLSSGFLISTQQIQAEDLEQNITIEVYVREGCPHCADAKVFLANFTQQHPHIHVAYHWVDKDPAARGALEYHTRKAGSWPPGVPTFVIGDQVLIGYAGPEHTSTSLLNLVVHHTGNAANRLLPKQDNTTVESSLLGTLNVTELGLPLFTIALGLLDGFNPCAMWVLLFLLSMLLHLKDRARMAWIAGVFVLVSGLVYYAFMAAWLNLFIAVGFSDPVRLGLAAIAIFMAGINIKDYFAFGKGISLSIPDAAKPGLYARVRRIIQQQSLWPALLGVSLLAIVVNFIEALCTAGLPAIYTAVLSQQALTPLAHYGYLALYILGYMADDSLMVATAVIALSSNKLTEKAGRWLKLLSGCIMLALALVLLIKPEWLS